MNFNFDFLTNIAPVEITKEPTLRKGRTATPKNPEGLRLRIFKDGAVYPSQELTAIFKLEYGVEGSNGFDIINSIQWGQYPKDAQQCIFIAAVSKNVAKVDLFGSSKIENASVLTQGAKRPELVEMLREVYDKHIIQNISQDNPEAVEDELFGSKNYVDLDILTDVKVFEGLPAYYIPKIQSRGDLKGKPTYITRTGLTIMPLTIHIPVAATFGELTDSVEEVENKELEETV